MKDNILKYINKQYQRLSEHICNSKLDTHYEIGYLQGSLTQLMELAKFIKNQQAEDKITELYLSSDDATKIVKH